jgi:hypothetical protein
VRPLAFEERALHDDFLQYLQGGSGELSSFNQGVVMQEPKYMKLGAAAMLALAFAGGAMPALAQDLTQDRDRDQARQQDRDRDRDQDFIYGSQLMTQQERLQYQNRIRTFKTEQEREAYRLEHHRLMQQRARERGVQLPDEPPMMGGGAMGGAAGGGGGAAGGGGRSGR